VTVTGPAGAIPVLPNAGVAVTMATGGAGVRARPAKAVLSAAPTGSDVTGMLGSMLGPAVTVAVADVGGVADNEPFPQPAIARMLSPTTRIRERRRPRRSQLLKFSFLPDQG